jgi:hypothetical protein
MYVIRDVFRCKPGHSKSVAEKFKNAVALEKKKKGSSSGRVLVDFIADYWTVVFETQVETLAQFEQEMAEYASSSEMRDVMKGYMDEVEGGHREIFRVV